MPTLVLSACLLMSGVPTLALAGAAGPETYEQLVDEGATLLEDGKLVEGAERLGTAYEQMPAEQQVGDLGKFVVVRASDAYESAIEADGDPALLRAHKALLDSFFGALSDARAKGASTADKDDQEMMLAERRDRLEQRLSELDAAAEAERKAAEEDEAAARRAAEDEEARRRAATADDGPKRKPDGVALGLLVGGGVALAGGVVLAVQGGRFPGLIDEAKQEGLETYGLTSEPEEWSDHEQQQFGIGRALLASGITLAVVGAGALTWGAVRLIRSRKGKTTSAALPMPLRRGAGVAVTVGF